MWSHHSAGQRSDLNGQWELTPSKPTTKLRRAISLFLPDAVFPPSKQGPCSTTARVWGRTRPPSPPAELLNSTPTRVTQQSTGQRGPLPKGLIGGKDFTVQVGQISGHLVIALKAKLSALSPPQPQLVSPPLPARRAGKCGAGNVTTSSSGALGDTHPFTTKKGSSMDMASRPPAASRLHSAQGAHTLRSSLHPPPTVAGASALGAPVQRAQAWAGERDRTTAGPALGGTADRIPDCGPAPVGASTPSSTRRVGRPDPAPGTQGLGQPPALPVHHFRTHVTRACAALHGRGLGTQHSTVEVGLWGSLDPPLRIQGEEPLVLKKTGRCLGFTIVLMCTILLLFLYVLLL